jgi:hypothetical protein
MATACGLPPPYERAFADFPDTVFDANEFADCCDFLLADDSPAGEPAALRAGDARISERGRG